ncbi:putative immune-responsive protein [Polyplosphaeria fusca]|uniref:Immune-responsive protein n=1 Tax=Polyplosphaeria fusca TaxID=682080 RepID=A0A9P4R7E1_9PLEO|nr:putative immune-responsive protein [Polyplosphaeria fusca]
MEADGATGQLCNWAGSIQLQDIPEHIKTRAKYLILDGIGCGLVGAHLDWSEIAANGVMAMEGSQQKLPPLPAALLNSTFIQSFELDDWHSEAPLHSNSIILPALFAAAQQQKAKTSRPTSGAELLLSTIIGYEAGPRIGLALHGSHMLSTGWHSGAVFGPPASAIAVSKLLGLSAGTIEDALGIACTQAGGLMSAQYESMVKRMQHGFAARNGLFAALMAQSGYIGIKKVFEREYGGYLSCFSRGNGKEPQWRIDEISKELGETWQTEGIRVKRHASMAATHTTIECIAALQTEHPKMFEDLTKIKSILVELGEASFLHGGFEIKKPLTATGAQMSNRYCAATQLVDGSVLPAQFSHSKLERDEVWELVEKVHCIHNASMGNLYLTRVTVEFDAGTKVVKELAAPRSVTPGLTDEEILNKWRMITAHVLDVDRREKIEGLVLNLDEQGDLMELCALLEKTTTNPIAE